MEFVVIGYLLLFIGLFGYFWRRVNLMGKVEIVDKGQGLFGPIDLLKRYDGEVWLRMCGVVQGVNALTFRDRKSYWHAVARLIVDRMSGRKDEESQVLYLGLGGGTIPRLVADALPDLRQVVIEIDPKIIEVVKQDFGLNVVTSIEIRREDAFDLVKRNVKFTALFDVVLVDVFSDFESLDEPQSIQREFMDYYTAQLKPGGMLIVNQPSHTSKALESVRKVETLLGELYGTVRVYKVHDRKRFFKNVVLVVESLHE